MKKPSFIPNNFATDFKSIYKFNLYNGVIDKIQSIGGQYAKKMFDSKVKSHFGKDYYIYNCNVRNKSSAGIFDFLEKYDNMYSFKYDSNTHHLNAYSSISRLEGNHTWMFVSTGSEISINVNELVLKYTDKNNMESPDIYIYIFGKKSKKYQAELEHILSQRATGNTGKSFYTVTKVSDDGTNISYTDFDARSMDTMFFSHKEIERIENHLDKFMSRREFYEDRQLLYKTGILLYGNPGTGKSSLAKAIATKYHRSIISINLSNIDQIDFSEITPMITNDKMDEYIILLEDIDTLFPNLDREAKDVSDKKGDVINKLLQFLDSNSSPTNVVFVATTNHIDRLDKALIRDGRFDIKIEVKELNKADAHKFAESFGLSKEEAESAIRKYISDNPDNADAINQSALQNYILREMK